MGSRVLRVGARLDASHRVLVIFQPEVDAGDYGVHCVCQLSDAFVSQGACVRVASGWRGSRCTTAAVVVVWQR